MVLLGSYIHCKNSFTTVGCRKGRVYSCSRKHPKRTEDYVTEVVGIFCKGYGHELGRFGG